MRGWPRWTSTARCRSVTTWTCFDSYPAGTRCSRTSRWSRVFKPAKWWPVVALTSVLPLSAILHHLLFYPTTCMLAPFGVTDYTAAGCAAWLRADWSPRLAIAIAGCAYFLGIRSNDVRAATLAFVVAFAPLAVWIWDIPWSNRIVCRFLHDGRAGLLTRHL